jgi:CRISPR-associated protein Csb2
VLAIRCQFLQGTYQASPPGLLTESEWPPHPARLHAALVAAGWAWGDGEFSFAAAKVLRWLENQPPPLVATPPGSGAIRNSPTTFVPRNLTRAEVSALAGHLRARPPRSAAFQRESGRVSRIFPTRAVGDEPVWFVWPDATPSPDDTATLEQLAGDLQYLGSSRSPVLGTAIVRPVVDDAPWDGAQVFEPSGLAGSDGVHLRVANLGLTEKLLANRYAGSEIQLGASAAYRVRGSENSSGGAIAGPRGRMTPAAAEPNAPDRGPFAALLLRRRSGFGLTLSHAATVAGAYRAACLAVAGDEAPAVLHGHGDHPHAAFLALPNVGGRHSDGAILGVGVAIPAKTPSNQVEAIQAAVAGVDRLSIEGGKLSWQLDQIPVDDAPWTLRAQRWSGPARRWSTATPVVLDRYPKAERGFSLEDAIKLAFLNARLPEPSDGIKTSPTPMLPGGVTPALHTRPERLRGLTLHVTVTFPRPVVGPVLVGKGRYLGLGLFAPVHDYSDGSPKDSRDRL